MVAEQYLLKVATGELYTDCLERIKWKKTLKFGKHRHFESSHRRLIV